MLQVSPELYGDNNPRLFTYWTVCVLSTLKKKVFIYFSDLSCVSSCKLLKQGDVSAEDQEPGRKLGTRVIVNKVL